MKRDEVFGISGRIPANYVQRPKVDGRFNELLELKSNVVVYGGSKQGKTCLRKVNLESQRHIVVSCQSTASMQQLNGSILKALGYETTVSRERALSGGLKLHATAKGGIKFPWFAKAEAEVGAEGSGDVSQKTTTRPLEIDAGDPNDMISAIQAAHFDGVIVLEDFHYLPPQTQEQFSYQLKTYHEDSEIRFVVVAVWREAGRLARFNGDLTGRLDYVDADLWASHELKKVITEGERLLNLQFASGFKEELVEKCFNSVWVLQEACRVACKLAGVEETLGSRLSSLLQTRSKKL